MMNKNMLYLLSIFVLILSGCNTEKHPTINSIENVDQQLRRVLSQNNVSPLAKIHQPAAKVELGRMLFFDKIISGNKNISCATCHLPEAATSDDLPLSIGEGGVGKMKQRNPPSINGDKTPFSPRNSPDLFNRGEFSTLFWDGRVSTSAHEKDLTFSGKKLLKAGKPTSPAGFILPDGLENALAVQAMFPPTSDVEMRGNFHENPLTALDEWEYEGIWSILIERLLKIDTYKELFKKAYPNVKTKDLSFVHAANAIASFEIEAFTLVDSPFNMYLEGDDNALQENAKHGALLFYQKAGCGSCHTGPLMTDQKFHNRVVPQIGPGMGNLPGGGLEGTWDAGRGGVTGYTKDYYSFRTPPLHNVAATGPWMHDGAISTLEAAVRHQLTPLESAKNYDPSIHLPRIYAELTRPEQTETIASLADHSKLTPVNLSDSEIKQILAFLRALTSPKLYDLATLRPDEVPSGLELD